MQNPLLDRIDFNRWAQDYWQFSGLGDMDPISHFEINPIIAPEKDAFENNWIERICEEVSSSSPGKILDVGAGDGRLARKLRHVGQEVTCLEPSSKYAQSLSNDNFDVIESSWLDWDGSDRCETLVFCRSFVVCALEKGRLELVKAVKKAVDHTAQRGMVIYPPIERLRNPGPMSPYLFPGGLLKPFYTPAVYLFFELGLFPRIQFFSMVERKEYESIEECRKKDFKRIDSRAPVDSYLKANCRRNNGIFFREREMVTMILSWGEK